MNYRAELATKLGLRTTDIDQILSVLANYPSVEQVSIFGSRAKGTHRNGSDVDIALWGECITDSVVRDVRHQLNEETSMPYMFDVVDATHLTNTDLLGHIKRVQVRIW